MLRRTLVPGVLSLSLVLSGAISRAEQGKGPTAVAKPVAFAVSAPARDLPMVQAPSKEGRGAEWERENDRLPKSLNPKAGDVRDEALQGPILAPLGPMPSPLVSFEGLSSQDNQNAFGFRVYPSDTNGAVGPSHYVQQTNLLVGVWDKTGSPLGAPFKLSSLFSTLGGQCAAPDDGDPVVLYDQMADRWILSQFGFFANGNVPPYHECIAVSTTGDPTGTYYLYDFVTPGNEFPDYPKLGVWPDGYYMTTNQFLNGDNFDGAGVFAFDRVKMLAGDPSATLIYFNLDLASHPEAIGGMLPSSLDGLTLPPAGAPNTFAYFISTLFGDPSNGIRLFDFHADFAVPAASTFTERSESPVAVAAFDPRAPNTRNIVEQPAPATSSAYLDVISDRLMHRLAYRNFGTSQVLVVNHTVNVSGVSPTTAANEQAGIRFYQLKRTGSTYSVDQQATYNPGPINGATGPNYWMGSTAMDHQGNLALGYSVSSTSIFPSIRYNGRLAGDPPGLSFSEGTMAAGSGVQLGVAGRWGDYSAMVVDPTDDCTFWYTTEYYTAASQASSSVGWLTHVASFKFPSCTASARGTLTVTVKDCDTNNPVAGVTVQAGGFFAVTDGTGVATFPPMAPGSYTVDAGSIGYLHGTAPATVTAGGTVNVNVCVTAVPVLQNAGAALISESCSPPNGAVDPSETVTVSLCVKNIGAKDTTNLVGTLEATGGVTSPGGPQTFGVVAAGGGNVCRNFTFTAGGICGGTLTATLNLVDGSLGSLATYSAIEGAVQFPFAQNFDSVTAPALPAGWVAANAAGPAPLWVTSTTSPNSAPNDAFVDDPGSISDKRLDSPTIAIASPTALLAFWNSFNLEDGFDGGVLEISIGGGPFSDILDAGGSFVTGGYNRTISSGFSNPLAGRQAWSSNSGGYISTIVVLPASAGGKNIVLRWRMGSDSGVSATGWRIDGLLLADYACCVAGSFTPQALAVDLHSGTGSTGNLNRVIEPGERVVIEPSWRNESSGALSPTGVASSLTGPTGTYTINDATSVFGSVGAATTGSCFATGDCFQMTVAISGSRPATHWDATFHDALNTGASKTWKLHIGDSFTDVPTSNPFYRFIETLLHNGITAGCGGANYCPGNNISRQQMAVFLLLSKDGPGYVPAPCATPVFSDVPCSSGFARWVNELAARGVTAGCGGGNYCPTADVTRAQMAVFLLRTLEGASYAPPACVTPVFSDVPCSSGFAPWINELAARGITAGCGGGNYCPSNPNTRGQMAVFLTTTFGLTLYGP